MYFYEENIRDTAARRAAAVIDALAAISALSDSEHVQAHLASLEAVAHPAQLEAPDGSYTKSSNTNVFVI